MSKPAKPKGGRPTKLSKEIQDHIVASIRIGVPREMAFRAAGLDPKAPFQWLKRGRDGDPVYREFAEAIEKADAEFVRLGLGTIAAASKKQWQAAAWMLERRLPAQFGQRVRVTVEEQLNGFLDKLEGTLPDDVYDLVLNAATASLGGPATRATGTEETGDDADEGETTPPIR